MYQVQRRDNFDGVESLVTLSKHRTPVKALAVMKKLAMSDLDVLLSNYVEVSIAGTSDSRYPDAWGMANNGILFKAGEYWWQWEVVEI